MESEASDSKLVPQPPPPLPQQQQQQQQQQQPTTIQPLQPGQVPSQVQQPPQQNTPVPPASASAAAALASTVSPVVVAPASSIAQAQQSSPQLQVQPQLQQDSVKTSTQSPNPTQAATCLIATSPNLSTMPRLQQIPPKIQPQLLQTKFQPPLLQSTVLPSEPIPLTSATNQSIGPTALVIIPQNSSVTAVTQNKPATISAKSNSIPNTIGVATTHVTLPPTTQSTSIQLQASIQTHVPNITTVPVTAHQQPTTVVQTTFTSRPPSSLPIVPVSAAPTIVQSDPNKYICCLLDNGIRCDRVAGNASFNARIQKIVGTKKMNFALDPTVRHAYICEHHKGIITVAKKSATLARDTKSNARNCTANNNANNLVSHAHLDYEFSMRQQQQQQQALQHPANLELLNNQNRLTNNHTGILNSMPVRQGAHLAYGHFQGSHGNQMGFEHVGGDSVPSSSSSIDVDLQQLQVNTLRRYKRHFRVPTRPGLNKMQLAESLKGHFRTLPIIEKEAITYFVYIVKCYRNKLDHNPKAD